MKLLKGLLVFSTFVIGLGLSFILHSHIMVGVSFAAITLTIIVCKQILKEEKTNTEDQYNKELGDHLKSTASYSAHLTNVISGINHEVSPWIGGIQNIITRLQSQYETDPEKACKNLQNKLENIQSACDQTRKLLSHLSINVKKINHYNNDRGNLLDTIESWVNITLMDRFIKDLIDETNFSVEKDTLDWDTFHSPMLLAQVILNLVKNSIEHNPEMLDHLKIKFEGCSKNKEFIYTDNGKGIPEHIIDDVFQAGITTKNDKNQHGFGLALCMEYCLSMGATIKAIKNDNGACFVISFEQASTPKFQSQTEKSQSSGLYKKNIPCGNCRTIAPNIKGDSTYGKGDLPNMSEGDSQP